jgi:hypothetical protein
MKTISAVKKFPVFVPAAILLAGTPLNAQRPSWEIVRIIEHPNEGDQQTASLVLDIDLDGTDDFVITERTASPSVVWYKYNCRSWDKNIIETEPLSIEAGGASLDIDRDGDPDILFGGDSRSRQIWWWENPYPDYSGSWARHLVKDSGGNKHHDQIFGDFDHDGRTDLVSWNQFDSLLLMFDIPEASNEGSKDPASETWDFIPIYKGVPQDEGLAAADINLDGKLDIVGAGKWFEHKQGKAFDVHVIDEQMNFTRAAAGQLVEGGPPEVLFCPGDARGDAKWYEWKNGSWKAHTLDYIIHGHTLEIKDFNRDGKQDILIGEMGDPGAGDTADLMIWWGDGTGSFEKEIIRTGQGIHEGRTGDLNGDGVLDILVKPYHHHAPGIELMLGRFSYKLPLDRWTAHKIDDLPERAVFVRPADLDMDGDPDIILGGYWYENPGSIENPWKRHQIGIPMRNMAVLCDFDRDGDVDILGTQGIGSEANHDFLWTENDGRGQFTLHTNIDYSGEGDFLQGCILVNNPDERLVVLSWHDQESRILALRVPSNPLKETWKTVFLSDLSLKEELCAGDIDRDGDQDLLLGTRWLEQSPDGWQSHILGEVGQEGSEPDRNRLADMDGDGRPDAVISLENGTEVYLFSQPGNPDGPWVRQTIALVEGQGFSMDAADFDLDNDPDVVIGEHRGTGQNRVLILENPGNQDAWKVIQVDRQSKDTIDHHDGTVAVDLDGDGDTDIISIGWYNPKLWIFENKAVLHH